MRASIWPIEYIPAYYWTDDYWPDAGVLVVSTWVEELILDSPITVALELASPITKAVTLGSPITKTLTLDSPLGG